MANYIKNLKEDNNDITYPITKAGAVYLNSGTDLESKVGTLVSADEIAATSPSTPLVGTNMINDKAVTADKIDWTTMNIVDVAYEPGDTITMGYGVSLVGQTVDSSGGIEWIIPLSKSLQFVNGCTVTLSSTLNNYYFFSFNQDAYPGWGRPNVGSYTGTIIEYGIKFKTTLASGTSNGRINNYSGCIGLFNGITITFS